MVVYGSPDMNNFLLLFEIIRLDPSKATIMALAASAATPETQRECFEKWIVEEIGNNLCSYHCLAQICWGILCQ